MTLILCAIGLPLLLAILLVAADIRTDLSDLIPSESLSEPGTFLIGWKDLERDNGISLEEQRSHNGRRVRLLGYMVDGQMAERRIAGRDGVPIEGFTLLPEAGQFLHPAHRIPDQMVEVRLMHPMPFRFRSLVWATGTLEGMNQRGDSHTADYALTGAEAQPAVQSDITLWFKP